MLGVTTERKPYIISPIPQYTFIYPHTHTKKKRDSLLSVSMETVSSAWLLQDKNSRGNNYRTNTLEFMCGDTQTRSPAY